MIRAFSTAPDAKDEVARRLAEVHFSVDPGITRIIRLTGAIEDEPKEPIKLLEINEETVGAGIQPIYFGPHPDSGITFPSIIVEVRPEEFEQIKRGNLVLPNGWSMDTEYHRPQD